MAISHLKRRAMIARYRTNLKRQNSPAAPTEIGTLKQELEVKTEFVISGTYQGFNPVSGQHEFLSPDDAIIGGELLLNGNTEIGQKVKLLAPDNVGLNPGYGSKVF